MGQTLPVSDAAAQRGGLTGCLLVIEIVWGLLILRMTLFCFVVPPCAIKGAFFSPLCDAWFVCVCVCVGPAAAVGVVVGRRKHTHAQKTQGGFTHQIPGQFHAAPAGAIRSDAEFTNLGRD